MLPWMNKKCARQMSLLAMIIGLLSMPLSGRELTQPLTPEEVACDERQLERLLQRMSSGQVFYITPQLPTTLLVSSSKPEGSYSGLVATFQGFRLGPGELPPTHYFEHYLGFNITSERHTLLLNPDRNPLPQISLNRDASRTNLVTPGGYFDLTLTLAPSNGGEGLLAINNFREPKIGEPYNGFLASSTKPERFLAEDGLLTPCHDKFTDFDRHVFSMLQRVFRLAAMSEFFLPDVEVAVFRGTDPHTYRINAYPIYEEFEPRGRMAAEVRISWTEDGRLTAGESKLFPACTAEGQLQCTSLRGSSLTVFLIHPVFGGHEFYDTDAVQPGGFYVWYEGPSEPRTLNFEDLLAGTTWNEPVW